MQYPYPDEPTWWNAFRDEVLAKYDEAKEPFNMDGFRWWARTAYDIAAGLSPDSSKMKHLAELDEELGSTPTPIPGVHPFPLVGQLRYGNNCYQDDAGPVNPVMVHSGDLIGQGLVYGVARITPILDQFVAAGYHGVRSWINVDAKPDNPFWSTKPAPRWNLLDNKQLFVEILQEGAKRNLRWHLASGGLDGLSNERENEMFDFLAEAIGIVGPQYFALIETCNEVRDTGDPDDKEPSELERLIQRVRNHHPSLLYSLSAYTGTEDREILSSYTPSFGSHYYLHGYRGGHYWDKIRHIFSNGYEALTGDPKLKYLGWQGEPFGPGRLVSATDNKHELNKDVMVLAAAMSVMARNTWTYMSGPGVIAYDEPFASMAGFNETPIVIQSLPRDLMTFRTLSHSGENKRGTRIHVAEGEVRADYAIHDDGRYVEITYGPFEQNMNLRQERPTTSVVRVFDSPYGKIEIGRLA